MEILTNYNEDTLRLISDDVNYEVINFWEYYVDSHFNLINEWNQIKATIPEYLDIQGVEDKESYGQVHYGNNAQTYGLGYPIIKLSVFSDGGSFLTSGRLENEHPPYNRIFSDFYIKDNQISIS